MKFTIRDLLWLTVVVALGVAWWVDWGAHAKQIHQLELDLHRFGGITRHW